MQKRVIAFSVLFLLGIFISLSLISADYCSIVPKAECNSSVSGVPVLNLSASSNAHGELVTATGVGASSYPDTVCCYHISNSSRTCSKASNSYYAVLGTKVPANKVIGLSSATNAHAEMTGLTNYNTNVCSSKLSNCENISSSSLCNSSQSYISVVNLSAPTNAHIGSLGTQICCQVSGLAAGTLSCKLTNATWSYSPSEVGNKVALIVNGTGCVSGSSSAGITFQVYNSSGIASMFTAPGSVQFPTKGEAVYNWTIQIGSSQYNLPASGQKLVFKASVSNGGSSTIWSNSTGAGPTQQLQVYPQKVDCNKIGLNYAGYNSSSNYHKGTDPTVYDMQNACSSDPCNVSGLIYTSPGSGSWIYGLIWQWDNISNKQKGGTCSYFVKQTVGGTASNPTCQSGTTLCYNLTDTYNPYFCALGSTCPIDTATGSPMNPTPPSSTCGEKAGCVNPICNTGDQDSCVSGAVCYKTTLGGLCLSSSSVPELPGSEEYATSGGTVMAFPLSGSSVTFSLPPGSNSSYGSNLTLLPEGGSLNLSFSSSHDLVAVLSNSSDSWTLPSGSEVSTPDNVLVGIGSTGGYAYFPQGTVVEYPNGSKSAPSSGYLYKSIGIALQFASPTMGLMKGQTGAVEILGGSGAGYNIVSSTNPDVANVSLSDGNMLYVTGNNTGSTAVTVNDSVGDTATLTVSVTVPGTGINLPSFPNLLVGGFVEGTVSGGTGGYKIVSSTNSSVASVSLKSGNWLEVTGLKVGSTKITINDSSGDNATTKVTVISGGLISVIVNPSATGVPTAGEGQITCMGANGQISVYSMSSCPVGTTNAPGNCASLSTSGSSSTCSAGLICVKSGSGGYCHDPLIVAGECIRHTVSTSGNCSASNGLVEYNWTVTWTGTSSDQPSWCQAGHEVFNCPPQTELPVFTAYNAIEVIVILAAIYAAVVFAKKKSKKHSGKRKSREKKS